MSTADNDEVPTTLPEKQTTRPGPPVLRAGCLAGIGIFAHLWQTQSTAEFRELGVLWSLMLMGGVVVFLLPTCAVLALAIEWIERHGCCPRWVDGRAIRILGVMLCAWGIVAGFRDSRPMSRFKAITGMKKSGVSEVEAAGFASFLAQRWCFSFQVNVEDTAKIVSSLGLTRDDSIDLRASLRRDVVFEEKLPQAMRDLPGPEALTSYRESMNEGQRNAWVMLSVDESQHRAWFYVGSQN